jgi:hypothetical protein
MTALWRGELPLAQAFWLHAVIWVAAANVLAAAVGLALLAADGPIAAAVIVMFLLPAPYTVAAVVGTWRSARSYEGERRWATMARAASLAWGVIMLLV